MNYMHSPVLLFLSYNLQLIKKHLKFSKLYIQLAAFYFSARKKVSIDKSLLELSN